MLTVETLSDSDLTVFQENPKRLHLKLNSSRELHLASIAWVTNNGDTSLPEAVSSSEQVHNSKQSLNFWILACVNLVPSSSHNAFNQTASLVAVESAIHYASVVDRATTDCKFDLHETVFCVTIDNATTNSSALQIFQIEFSLVSEEALVLDGNRLSSFEQTVDVAMKFRVAFDKMEQEDKLYNYYFMEMEGPPQFTDWKAIESMFKEYSDRYGKSKEEQSDHSKNSKAQASPYAETESSLSMDLVEDGFGYKRIDRRVCCSIIFEEKLYQVSDSFPDGKRYHDYGFL
ncbi:hypothetical protein YC2023_088894 [Brassica napus]